MPLLSVIVTVYNQGSYIEQCLMSIINQDYDDYELIVVDNGSSDSSIDICQLYYEKYPNKIRLFLLSRPTLIGRAHAKGVYEAKGEYIQFVDGDDYIEPNCLRAIANILTSKKPDVLIGTYNCILEEKALNLNDAVFNGEYINNSRYDDSLIYLSKLANFHPLPWRFIYKREIQYDIDIGIKDIETEYNISTNDWWFTTKILISASSISYLEKPFYNYRRRYIDTMSVRAMKLENYFLTFIVVLRELTKIKKNSARYNFVISRLILLLNNFIAGSYNISDDKLLNLEKVLNKNKNFFDELNECGENGLSKVYDFIEKYGIKNGLRELKIVEHSNLLNKLENNRDKDVFIFPTGIMGQSTAIFLMNNGFRIKGFIDNDNTKWGREFEETSCYSPMHIVEYNNRNDIVVISTIYDDLKYVLKKQLNDLNLNDNRIVIADICV